MSTKNMIKTVAEQTGQTQVAVTAILNTLAEQAAAALRKGEDFILPGIGKLKPVERAARVGRNPVTGVLIQIPARKAVKLSASSSLLGSIG